MILRSPVRGVIAPNAESRKKGQFGVTQGFGPSPIADEPSIAWPGGDGIAARTYKHFHPAIDLGNRGSGADVLAAGDGVVIFARVVTPGGINIWIDHGGGAITGYAHLADRLVGKDAKVKAGQVIGHVGTTNGSLPPAPAHLHFAYKENQRRNGNVFSQADGAFHDPWPRLAQNVKVHLRPGAEINIRTEPKLAKATIYAKATAGGRIVRGADGVDIGSAADWRPWGGQVTGERYPVDDDPDGDDRWEKIELDGGTRFIATAFAVRSVT